jgi:hypothetical protein
LKKAIQQRIELGREARCGRVHCSAIGPGEMTCKFQLDKVRRETAWL